MFPEETRGRQDRLIEIIYELSKTLLNNEDDKEIRQYLGRLSVIYKDNFRHNYSEFFPVLMKIYKDDNVYNIDYLSNNLYMLEAFLQQEYPQGNNEYSDMYIQFTKLNDNLSLQICQFNFLLSENEAVGILLDANKNLATSKKLIEETAERQEDIYEKIEGTKLRLEESNKKADTLQTDFIAMLSIFAAIVIAFSGGLSLLGSSISSINYAKHYESVIIIAIICGMVMFNTIFLLMYFIAKLTKKNISVVCKAETCIECKEVQCKGLNKIRKRYPYVFYYNCLSMIGIVIDLIIWFMDIRGYIG